ncbi:hypothetical protein ACLI1A_04820 [Flavobacterium sp. RHBU_3]|uniref:hypothetical protein n=1 Tax=Flavobacterium sp. RHBU_3 TaxID=3391184 RepID=UPI003985564A
MKKLLMALLLMPCFSIFAQIKFEQGYIVNNEGVKTECLVKNRDWHQTPESFEYKVSENAAVEKATTENTLEISVGNQTFRKYTVNIDRSSDAVAYLTTSSDPVYQREKVFLKVMVAAPVSLYKYYDGEMLRYFYSTPDMEGPQQLICKMYRGKVDREDNKILYNKTYKSTLQKLMRDKIVDATVFKDLDYKDKDLVKLFNSYNGITADKSSVAENEEKSRGKIHLKVTAGALLASLKADFATYADEEFDSGSKAIAVMGAEVEWILPINKNKWAFFIAPSYMSYTNSSSKTYGEGISQTYNKWDVDYKAINVPLGARYYMFLNDKTKLFVEGTYVYSTGLGDSKLTFTEGNVNGPSLVVDAEIKKQSSYMAGLGVSYSKFALSVRYFGKRSITNGYGNWSSNFTGIGAFASYTIF